MTNSPRRVYLDANVFIAYLANEPGRGPVVASLFEDAKRGRIELLTSVLTVTEVAFVASEQTSSNPNAEEDAIAKLWVPESPVKLTDISMRVAERAREIVRVTNRSGIRGVKPPDAIHLASAEVHGCQDFFTYEGETTRDQWERWVELTVSEPYTENPQLDLN